MEFIIATNNKKKLREMGAILEKLGLDAAKNNSEVDAKAQENAMPESLIFNPTPTDDVELQIFEYA